MPTAALIYPHQLFDPHPALDGANCAVLVEEPLFFTQYRFHRQKLLLHRASLKRFAAGLAAQGMKVRYVEAHVLGETGAIGKLLRDWKIDAVQVVGCNDDFLSARLATGLKSAKIELRVMDDPHFLTPQSHIDQFVSGRQKLFFTDFYIAQRKRLNILIDDGKPVGGKWSFDPENRKRLPRNIAPPPIKFPAEDEYVREARQYVRENLPDAIGADEPFRYPIDHAAARKWLREFIRHRFAQFGDYEDAISKEHDVLFHSMLTPMLNIGLLSPQEVVDAALAADDVPINSREGFIRQVIGWREFIRLVYRTKSRRQRTRNFWNFQHKLPAAFYDGTTGIDPVDHVIRRVLATGYCHHIERLMVLGNFMLLCEIHPDAVYQWFMEMFIDAYDWVMVPNVYGMSQHADGGLMTTKPYISGSSYIRKMSDFPAGEWCAIWDALYWRFVDKHADFFAANPRMAVMVKLKGKLGGKLIEHRRVAEGFLKQLHGT